jgi:hypothetical protein
VKVCYGVLGWPQLQQRAGIQHRLRAPHTAKDSAARQRSLMARGVGGCASERTRGPAPGLPCQQQCQRTSLTPAGSGWWRRSARHSWASQGSRLAS